MDNLERAVCFMIIGIFVGAALILVFFEPSLEIHCK
jgi:hypothetical protein